MLNKTDFKVVQYLNISINNTTLYTFLKKMKLND